VLALPARVRLPEATETLADLMARSVGQTESLRVSLSELRDSDSSVLAVLLALRRARGDALDIQDIPERVRNLARLYGVEDLLFGQTP
jgi:phospholipid transport system transporter-binding protein